MNISEQVKELRIEAKWLAGEQEKRLTSMLREAADTIETLSTKLNAANIEQSDRYYNSGWVTCDLETLPESEVVCCDNHGEMILGYIFSDETSETGFGAENDNEYMYNCVKWMEKPKP